MVIQRLDDDAHAFLVLDDQGRVIGRVQDTEYPLDRLPPEDTVFMATVPPRDAGGRRGQPPS